MLADGGVKCFQLDYREAAQTAASFRMVIADWLAFQLATFLPRSLLYRGFGLVQFGRASVRGNPRSHESIRF